jgi:bifunctional enzyme CysN/CysC
LSGSGKSTLATALEYQLHRRGLATFILDGDNLRHGLCSNLKFSPEDRSENIRRAGETAKLMAEAGMVVICSLISPYQSDRARVREICQRDGIPFAEVFINAPLQVCEERDPRGLYKKARTGEIKDFTGVSSPYEPPTNAELEILTSESTMEASLSQLLDFANAFARKLESSPATEQTAGSGI